MMQNDFQAKTKDSFPTMESLDQLAFDFKEMIRVREENHRLIEDLLVQRLRDEAKLVNTSFQIFFIVGILCSRHFIFHI